MVDIGFSICQFSDLLYVDEIVFNDGILNLLFYFVDLLFVVDWLMLCNMVFNSLEIGWVFSVQCVIGGVSLWMLEVGNVLGKMVQIQMSVGLMMFNGVEVSNVLIQGKIDQGEVIFFIFGVDVVCGILIGNVKCSVDGSWWVDNFQFNEI